MMSGFAEETVVDEGGKSRVRNRLDLTRIGVAPDPDVLNTETARCIARGEESDRRTRTRLRGLNFY